MFDPIASTSSVNARITSSYFKDRLSNDAKRVKQFRIDSDLVNKYISRGNLCDVGCSTGEFLKVLDFSGNLYGIEVNHYAKEVASSFISFDKDIFNQIDFFDAVIFRGTIQHVDCPFYMIKASLRALKPGGYLIFLATPNSDSILYKLKNTLPFLDDGLNFYIPGKKHFCNALTNYGFEILEVQTPYLKTPYANLFQDHILFILNILPFGFYKHSFWGSMMNIVAQKPYH